MKMHRSTVGPTPRFTKSPIASRSGSAAARSSMCARSNAGGQCSASSWRAVSRKSSWSSDRVKSTGVSSLSRSYVGAERPAVDGREPGPPAHVLGDDRGARPYPGVLEMEIDGQVLGGIVVRLRRRGDEREVAERVRQHLGIGAAARLELRGEVVH